MDSQPQKGIGALVIIIIIAAIALVGSIAALNMKRLVSPTSTEQMGTATPQSAGFSGTYTVSSDTSDLALDNDTADVNTKLNSLDSDSANVDASFNDQQGDLSEQ